ncbi:MAG: J domain-containing protein [Oceanospirillales bacterium]|nr:J domain-containing protein [Oceanospirillales bacterium]
MFIDYYSILEIFPPSNPLEIKSSYRKQASKWHPDRCEESDSVEMMQKINEAYFILKTPASKQIYDLEYETYVNTYKTPSIPSKNSSFVVNNSFEYSNEEMKDWIKKAQFFAQTMAKKSFDDTTGLTSSMFGGVVEKIPSILFFLLVIALLNYIYKA